MLAHLRALLKHIGVALGPDEHVATAADEMVAIATQQVDVLVIDLAGGRSAPTFTHDIKNVACVQVIAS